MSLLVVVRLRPLLLLLLLLVVVLRLRPPLRLMRLLLRQGGRAGARA